MRGSESLLSALATDDGNFSGSVWTALPGVLPGGGDGLEVSAEGGVGAGAVTEFEGLMLTERNGDSGSDA